MDSGTDLVLNKMSHRIQCFGGPIDGWFLDTESFFPFYRFNITEAPISLYESCQNPKTVIIKEHLYKLKRSAESGDLWYVYENKPANQ
jgi:hypothetical protein